MLNTNEANYKILIDNVTDFSLRHLGSEWVNNNVDYPTPFNIKLKVTELINTCENEFIRGLALLSADKVDYVELYEAWLDDYYNESETSKIWLENE